jgi:hypothetical protein
LNFRFTESDLGSTFVLIESMSIHSTANFDSTIPRVKAYEAGETKFVLVDAGDIEGAVGLLTDIDCTTAEKRDRRRVSTGIEKSFKYVIQPGRAFPKNLKGVLGKTSNLFIKRT